MAADRRSGRGGARPAGGAGGAGGGAPSGGPEATRHGPGRVLIAVYAVFALSATARAAYQLIAQYARAPLAYWLSAFAGVVYLVATVALARASARSRVLAAVAVTVELVGVLTVGTLTLARPSLFADATVWSDYGSGYGYVPAVLPVLGLAWLAATRAGRRRGGARPGRPAGRASRGAGG